MASRFLVLSAVILAVGTNGVYGCDRYAAPFFRGTGGFVVEPTDGRSADVTVSSADETDTRTVVAGRDGLVVQLLSSPLCTGPNGVLPAQCEVAFTGIRGGGWYWVNGDRNAAVAPLVCSDDLGGGPVPLDPGGVQTLPSRYGTGTLFVHDTQGLMGIIPRLSPTGRGATQSCERYVAPFFRGQGGFVARPESGRTAEVTVERGSSVTREPLNPRADGLAVQLLSDTLCTDANGEAVECKVSFAGIGGGGWYWVNGDRNAAVAPLVCEGRLAGSAAAVPGGVETSRAAFGTGSLFVHDIQRLMGIVPHLPGSAAAEPHVEVRVSIFGGGTVEAVGLAELDCPTATLCTGSFPATGSLTLRAVPPPGYALDAWRHCDDVADADCVVALHHDRMVFVDFLSTQPLTLKENVVTFDSYRLDDVRRYDPQSGLMVLAADARIHDIGVGSVLVSSVVDPNRDFESYFLRRVTGMRKQPGTPAYLKTTHATLGDLIAAGSLAARGALGPEAVTGYVLPPGLVPTSHPDSHLTVRELPDGRRAFDVSRQDQPPGRTSMPSSSTPRCTSTSTICLSAFEYRIGDSGVTVSGDIDFDIGTHFLLDAGVFKGLKHFMGIAVLESTAKLTVSKEGGGKAKVTYPLDKFKIKFGAIPAGPIVIVPELSGQLWADLDYRAGFEPTLELNVTSLAAGAEYWHETGWRPIWHFEYEPVLSGYTLDTNAKASANAGVQATLGTKVYGLAGPYFSIGPTVGVQASYDSSRQPCKGRFSAWVGGKATFGVEVGVILWTLKWEKDVWEKRLPVTLGDCVDDRKDIEELEKRSEPIQQLGQVSFPDVRATSVLVQWDDAPEVARGLEVHYEVQRLWNLGGDYNSGMESQNRERTIGHIPASTWTEGQDSTQVEVFRDTELHPDRQHCYSVRTVVAGRLRSAWSPVKCVRTLPLDVTPPGAPTALTAQVRSSGVIELGWSPASDAKDVEHYVVADVTRGTAPDEVVYIGSSEVTRYDATGLEPDTDYCFGVRAVDDAGNWSEILETACARTFDSSHATWRFRIACRGRDYQIEGAVDLDEEFVSVVSVVEDGTDYDGDRLTYALTGPYDYVTRVFDGTIDWSFVGQSGNRQDRFKADLSLSDTGDIAMSKSGSAAGCDAVIRFDRRDATATSDGSSGSARAPQGGRETAATFRRF